MELSILTLDKLSVVVRLLVILMQSLESNDSYQNSYSFETTITNIDVHFYVK